MGKNKKDHQFLQNWKSTKKHNYVRGDYHYYRPSENSTKQFNNFKSVVRLETGDFIPILDIEKESVFGRKNLRKGILNWLKLAEEAYGVKPMIYTGLSFYNHVLKGYVDNYPIWIAAYSGKHRVKNTDWMFHQFTEKVVIKGINEYVDKIKNDINLYNFPIEPKIIEKIVLIACGTAYHSCLVAKYWFEELTNIDVEIDVASEFRYRNIRFNKKNLYVFVSQSGETADTAAALQLCKDNNVKTCSVVNVVESTIARNSDWVLPLHAGPEVGVASTKAFLGQMLILYILCLKIAFNRNELNKEDYIKKINNLINLPKAIEDVLKQEDKIQIIAKDIYQANGSMFLGRGTSYPIALEGALKLKELSYLHAEGYPAGEMKHGPLALIEDGLPVIVIAPKDKYFEKTFSNTQEVIARGGKVLLVTDKNDLTINENIRFKLQVPFIEETLSPFILTIPLQLLAYHVALLKNCDIDKPRNLAKSVTVE